MAEVVQKVWIEPGCIVCDACETSAPDVFEVLEDTCIVRPAALESAFTKPRTEAIIEAAEECPVDVIKFETLTVEGEVAQVGGAPAAETAAEPESVEATPAAVAAATPAKPSTPPPPKAPVPIDAGDPAIQALLSAATARGGRAGMDRREQSIGPAAQALKATPVNDLPPDAKQAKVFNAVKEQKNQDEMSRAAFIGAAAVGWLAFTGTTVTSLGALQRFLFPNVLEEPDPRVRMAPIEQYAEMGPGEVNEDYKGVGIWIIRNEERIAALSTTCTHLGCIPNWLQTDQKFKCPCHGSGFTQKGINFEGPAPRPLERFQISLEDGIVVVDRSKKFQEEKGQWDDPNSYLTV
jgi:cytochrome b6-f complex iron-sulfur subunit